VNVDRPYATDCDEAELKEVRRENLTLKAARHRAQDERDILKAVLPLCRLVGWARNGYDAWVTCSPSQRSREGAGCGD